MVIQTASAVAAITGERMINATAAPMMSIPRLIASCVFRHAVTIPLIVLFFSNLFRFSPSAREDGHQLSFTQNAALKRFPHPEQRVA